MRLVIYLIISFSLFSCTFQSDKEITASYWTRVKDKFRYQNLQHFAIDTAFKNSYFNRGEVYKAFHTKKDHVLDSVLMQKNYYLYSWESQDTSFTAFTVVIETIGEALQMRYLIFDKAHHLISDFEVAKSGSEPGGYKYSTESFRTSPNTITTTSTRTFDIDQRTLEPLSKPIIDTIITKSGISKEGKVHNVLRQSSIYSKSYMDEQGWVTQKMINKRLK